VGRGEVYGTQEVGGKVDRQSGRVKRGIVRVSRRMAGKIVREREE